MQQMDNFIFTTPNEIMMFWINLDAPEPVIIREMDAFLNTSSHTSMSDVLNIIRFCRNYNRPWADMSRRLKLNIIKILCNSITHTRPLWNEIVERWGDNETQKQIDEKTEQFAFMYVVSEIPNETNTEIINCMCKYMLSLHQKYFYYCPTLHALAHVVDCCQDHFDWSSTRECVLQMLIHIIYNSLQPLDKASTDIIIRMLLDIVTYTSAVDENVEMVYGAIHHLFDTNDDIFPPASNMIKYIHTVPASFLARDFNIITTYIATLKTWIRKAIYHRVRGMLEQDDDVERVSALFLASLADIYTCRRTCVNSDTLVSAMSWTVQYAPMMEPNDALAVKVCGILEELVSCDRLIFLFGGLVSNIYDILLLQKCGGQFSKQLITLLIHSPRLFAAIVDIHYRYTIIMTNATEVEYIYPLHHARTTHIICNIIKITLSRLIAEDNIELHRRFVETLRQSRILTIISQTSYINASDITYIKQTLIANTLLKKCMAALRAQKNSADTVNYIHDVAFVKHLY